MEIEANELFDAYRELYFEGGTSSVYLWDLDRGFAGCFLVKKIVEGNAFVKEGYWNSIHVIEVQEEGTSKATYKLTTTVMLHMGVQRQEVGTTNLSGSLTRQAETTSAVTEVKTHIANIGGMIEHMENEMRSNLQELYILKTREVINSIRGTGDGPTQSAHHVQNLNSAVMTHGAMRKKDNE